MAAMIEILTVSSGMPTNSSMDTSTASHGLSVIGTCCSCSSRRPVGMALNAPRMAAVHTTRGGSGRLSAATTSQSSSKAGAMAEATMAPGTSSGRIITQETKPGTLQYKLRYMRARPRRTLMQERWSRRNPGFAQPDRSVKQPCEPIHQRDELAGMGQEVSDRHYRGRDEEPI